MRSALKHNALAAMLLLGPGGSEAAGKFKYVGAAAPVKHNDDTSIGKFINLDTPEKYGHVTFNIAAKYPDAKPWIHWGVGGWKEQADAFADDKHDAYLKYLDALGVEIWLAVRPDGREPVDLAKKYLGMFGKYPNVAGFAIDLEFYTITDAKAKAIDDAIKAINPKYRLMLKGYMDSMFPKYRGKGDLFFIHTSSEAPIPEIVGIHTTFANKMGKEVPPVAVGFQIGYPNDEKIGVHKVTNRTYDGWIAFKTPDPFTQWGKLILDRIENPNQELGFDWLTVTSSVTPAWDLTKGATIPGPTSISAPEARGGRFLRLERTSGGMKAILSDGTAVPAFPALSDLIGRSLVSSRSGAASGTYILRFPGEKALSAGITEAR